MIKFANQYQAVVPRQILFGMSHAEANREQHRNTQSDVGRANLAGRTFHSHRVLLSAVACLLAGNLHRVSIESVGQPCLDGSTGLAVTLKCWPSSKWAT